MRKLLVTLCLLASLWGAKARGQAANVYVTLTGSTYGVCTSSVQSASWFNNSANWGTGSTQIGPDTVVHLCGPFSSTNHSASMLSVQGSGTSGHPVVVRAEAGTDFTNTYWGLQGSSAIVDYGRGNYITFDGNNVGIIEDTANGTGLGNKAASSGAYFYNSTGIVFKNWTVRNMCVMAVTDTVVCATSGSNDDGVEFNNCTNCTAQNNTISNTFEGIFDSAGPNSTGDVYTGNTISSVNWGVAIGASSSTSVSNGAVVSFNHVTNAVNWDGTGTHHNCVILFTASVGTVENTIVNSNLCDGDVGDPSTSWCTFVDRNTPSGVTPNISIFNNVCVVTGTHYPGNAFINGMDAGGLIANNTVFGNSVNGGQGCMGSSLTTNNANFYNNICVGTSYGMWLNVASSIGSPSIGNSDYNDFYNLANGLQNGGTNYATLAAWTSATGFDSHSITTNPNLSGTYGISPSSPAAGAGKNLTSFCTGALTVLCVDKNGNARPASGAWDIGAFNATGGGGPATPTNISVIVVGP